MKLSPVLFVGTFLYEFPGTIYTYLAFGISSPGKASKLTRKEASFLRKSNVFFLKVSQTFFLRKSLGAIHKGRPAHPGEGV